MDYRQKLRVLENNESDPQDYKIKQQKELVSLGVDQEGPWKRWNNITENIIEAKSPNIMHL